jgi:hypothetical protein
MPDFNGFERAIVEATSCKEKHVAGVFSKHSPIASMVVCNNTLQTFSKVSIGVEGSVK